MNLGLPAVRGRRRLVLAMAVDSLGSGLFLPVSAVYFVVVKGLDVLAVGGALSLAALIAAAAGPVAGALVDRAGARTVVVASNAVRAVAFAGYPLGDEVWLAVLLVTLVEVGDNAYWPANAALLSRVASESEVRRWFALERAFRNAGIGLGAAMAGLLVTTVGRSGYTLIVVGNAVSFLLAGVVVATLSEGGRLSRSAAQSNEKAGGYRKVLTDRPFLAVLAANSLFVLCHMAFILLLTLYVVSTLQLDEWLAGMAFTANTVTVVTAQLHVTKMTERFDPVRILQSAAGLWAAGFTIFFLLLYVPTPWRIIGLIAAVGLLTAAELLETPTGMALVTTMAPEGLRGRYLGLHQLSWSLGGIVAPILLLGLLAADARLPWLALDIGCLLAAAVLLLLHRRKQVTP